jgi:hypothetical protein
MARAGRSDRMLDSMPEEDRALEAVADAVILHAYNVEKEAVRGW